MSAQPVTTGRRTLSRGLIAGLIVLLGFVAMNAAVGYVIIDGQLEGEWYDIRDLGIAVAELRGELNEDFDPAVAYLVTAMIGAVGILSIVGTALLVLPIVERRLLARFQVRHGPNRVGPYGLLQSLADALKLMQKESVIPRGADLFMYVIPPVLIFVPALLVWGPVPWAEQMTYTDLNVGVLYLIAITSLGTLGIFMAGWSSNNHYAALGAMRTVAMMVSYEIPLSISLLGVVLITGSMSLGEIVQWQADHNLWFAAFMPLALFTYFFASTAELNRTPNDMAEAESEIVAGYFTEYSGMRAGLFMAVELGNATAVSALVATLFLGGWSLFGLEEWVPGYLILLGKISALYFFFVWSRATLPRIRMDQLMMFAWKFLIPLSLAQTMLIAVEATIIARWDVEGIVSLGLLAIVNIALTILAVRQWARMLGYRPERIVAERPVLIADGFGGLEASARLNLTNERAGEA